MNEYNSLKNKKIFGKYRINKMIGRGSFGCVFQGRNVLDGTKVAIKFEKKNSKENLLIVESNYLSLLKGFGVPEIKSFGYHGNFYVLVEELLGSNLMQIKRAIQKFTIKEISMIAIQIIDRIEFVHSKNIIHRDIKPENFVFGLNNDSTLYIIDFGISRKYRSERKHLKFQMLGKLFGTVRYASYNASRGIEQSRRDDLESIGYMLIYLSTGNLPWQGVNLKDKNISKKYVEMLLLKKYLSYEVLCKGLPNEFISYVKYCRNLKFEEDPDYERLRNLFKSILLKNNEIYDLKFSWIVKKNNSKNKDLKEKNKYVNLLRRKQSPQMRLLRKIQKSLEKDDKDKSKKSSNVIEIKDNIKHIRETSDETTQYTKSDDFEEINFNSNSNTKSKLSYNSLLAHYDMDVKGFEDEQKMYKENISRINSIKNKRIDNFDIYSKIELKSYKKKNSNKNKKKEKIKNITNISLNLNKNLFKESNNNNTRYNSEKVKMKYNLYNIMNSNDELLKNDEKRKEFCRNIYTNIISKIKKHFDKFAETNRNIVIRRQRNNYSFTNVLNSKNIVQKQKFNQGNKISYNEESFSFKNNINKVIKENEVNINKKIQHTKINSTNNITFNEAKKINEQNMNNNKIYLSQKYKKLNSKIPIKKDNYNFNTNNVNLNIKNTIGSQTITDNNNSINIIINNNLSGLKKKSQTKKKLMGINKLISSSQKKIINHTKCISNNNLTNNIYDVKNCYNINKIPKNNQFKNEYKKIIQNINITKPIRKNYFLENQVNSFTYDNSMNAQNNNYENNNLNLYNMNNTLENRADLEKIKTINRHEYRPLYNQQNIIENNINNMAKLNKMNSFKSIRGSNPNFPVTNIIYQGNMKIMLLNNKNQINTSPQHNINVHMSGKNNKLFFERNKINNNNLNRINVILENNVLANKIKKISLPLKRFYQYSPMHYKLNKGYSLNIDDDMKMANNRRSNSNETMKKCLNFKSNSELDSLNYIPRNINSMNSTKKSNCIDKKCFNFYQNIY